MITYRIIQPQDNNGIAHVIREALREHGVDKPGTVFTDPTTDALFELFQTPGSIYWLALEGEEILGGCGIFPTSGLPKGCGELVKLYVSSKARGKGIGHHLMEISAESARLLGYDQLYLETLPELGKAITLYERSGYKRLNAPLGDSGHFACDIWMLKSL